MTIINEGQNPMVDSFFKKHLDEINDIFKNHKVKPIKFITEKTVLINAIIDENEYMGINFLDINFVLIGYRQTNIDKLKLTIDEFHAIIAHEFGHLFHGRDKYANTPTDNLQKEYDADDMAVRLNLAEPMKGALEKIIAEEMFSEIFNINDLKVRADRLSRLIS